MINGVGTAVLAAAAFTGAAVAALGAARANGRVTNIRGCDRRGDGDDVYLVRRWLLDFGRYGKLYHHTFKRSDYDVFHDHPWSFVTLILAGGYWEETLDARPRFLLPGQIHFRPAAWTHRVRLLELKNGRELPAKTLVWTGPVSRQWGFHLPSGWVNWREYFAREGCK